MVSCSFHEKKKTKLFKLFSLFWKAYLFINSSYYSYIFIHSFLKPLQNKAAFWLLSCVIITILKHILLSLKTVPCHFHSLYSLQINKCFLCLTLTFLKVLCPLTTILDALDLIIKLLTLLPFFSRLETLSSRIFTHLTLCYNGIVSILLTHRRQ